MAIRNDGDVLVTGGGDEEGRCVLVQVATGRVLGVFAGAHADGVESVCFCDSMPLVVSGALDGSIAIWDLQTQQLRATGRHEDAVTQLQFNSGSTTQFTSISMDRTVRQWDARTGQQLHCWQGHGEGILCMAFTHGQSDQASSVVTGGDDGVCLVFSAANA
jgi:WD40 repeat protein